MAESTTQTLSTKKLVNGVLGAIERDREREIVSRRSGLFERKETLEQIGELLGITRERVRQLEKSVMLKLKSAGKEHALPGLDSFSQQVVGILKDSGNVVRVSDLANQLVQGNDRNEQSRIAFLCDLCPELIVISDDDQYYTAVADSKLFNEKSLKQATSKIVEAVTKLGSPKPIANVANEASLSDNTQAEALASVSKQLASLNGQWGLVKWPLVNPKNIRDKIYVILKQNGKHMHFNEIASAIKGSDFRRKDVTTQAIHNELIKDKRFVLVGRGIYALKEWGYEKGTVADIISKVLKDAGEPLHRDEIVKRVLKSRYVKETTILLNLQGKPQFKRVAKATYDLVEA